LQEFTIGRQVGYKSLRIAFASKIAVFDRSIRRL